MTNAEARFNKSLRPRKPEGSLGRTAQDVHLDSHTTPELCVHLSHHYVVKSQRVLAFLSFSCCVHPSSTPTKISVCLSVCLSFSLCLCLSLSPFSRSLTVMSVDMVREANVKVLLQDRYIFSELGI